jgi:hypothetical protein
MLHTVSTTSASSPQPFYTLPTHQPTSPKPPQLMHGLHIRLHVHVHAWRSSRDPDPEHERDPITRA